MAADSTWHPYSHINLFQEPSLIKKIPNSFFVHNWPQSNIIKSEKKQFELRSCINLET
jgi:hypothetical protein